MSEPFLAEIKIVGFNFAPRGWAECDGQLLPISQNQSLFSILGTTYGGDGRTTFALPDLRGRTPIHADSSIGTSHPLGQKAGEENVVLNATQMPQHNHQFQIENSEGDSDPAGTKVISKSKNELRFADNADAATAQMSPATIGNTGAGQGHNNMQPYLVLNYVIALQGLFPSRN